MNLIELQKYRKCVNGLEHGQLYALSYSYIDSLLYETVNICYNIHCLIWEMWLFN